MTRLKQAVSQFETMRIIRSTWVTWQLERTLDKIYLTEVHGECRGTMQNKPVRTLEIHLAECALVWFLYPSTLISAVPGQTYSLHIFTFCTSPSPHGSAHVICSWSVLWWGRVPISPSQFIYTSFALNPCS